MSFQGSNGEDCCSIGWQNYFKANDDGIPADGRRLRRTETKKGGSCHGSYFWRSMTYRVSPTIIADMISFVVVDCALDQNLTAEEAFGGCLRRLGLMHSQTL